MRLRLDPTAAAPLSAQLRAALGARIERGTLAPGERLPPVRELASELGLAANTVAKAYRELEREGLLVTRGRHGTFVTRTLPERPSHAERSLADAADAFARRARQLGIDDADALRAIRRALGDGRATATGTAGPGAAPS